MNKIQRTMASLDDYQQRSHLFGFSVGVIKKYGEDEAGREAALLTYYSFLSLFPLLLLLTTLTDRILGGNPSLQSKVISSVTNYFPLLGSELSSHVHSLHRSGLALIVGILFLLYGTRGVANAFKRGVRTIWGVPEDHKEDFPVSVIKSLILIIVGGAGFILASVSAALAANAGHGLEFRGLSVLINICVLYLLFSFLINFSLPTHIPIEKVRVGAIVATLGLVIVQLLGNYILAHELKNLDALYSYFAVALGLLFWLYVQAQVLYYAMEIAVVKSNKLWPRSLR